MYRRIEFIGSCEFFPDESSQESRTHSFKVGAVHYSPACEVMCDKGLPDPTHWVAANKSRRYYFTEKGWCQVGRHIIHKLKKDGIRFRILKVKHREVDVLYADEYQVIVRPRNKPTRCQKRIQQHDDWN